MARVTLQEYCAEARERIDERAYDEAIAICHHILKRYPKHIKTYQILGEACLEKGDFEEATNIFKRLLEQADPENFVAYAGLGVMKEKKGHFEEAIWYMERAFELIPNRDEVRNALRKLYGKRDGAEPTRIKLNKAALARLYARGGQYRQAIEEFRTLLAQEPNRDRMDLKTSLAETLWRDGRREQAADLARGILRTCPNCLKAMLLLGIIQIEKGQDDDGWAILAQTRGLDPENSVAQALFGEQSPLLPKTVKIPRMEKKATVVPTEISEPVVSVEEEVAAKAPLEEKPVPEETPEAEAAPTAEEEIIAEPVEEEELIPEEAVEAEAVSAEIPELAAPVEEEITPEAAAEEEWIPEEAVEAEAVSAEIPEPAAPAEEEEEIAPEAAAEEEPTAEEMLEAEVMPAEVLEPAAPAEEEIITEAAPEEEPTSEEAPETEAVVAKVSEPEIPTPQQIAAAEITSAPFSDVERYKLHLEQMPKDNDTRLLLARAYRDQEQMKLALEQYDKLLRSKPHILSEAIHDVETVVASRPDNLEAHELLADLYAKNGQLQEAVDRYRWLLRSIETEPE